ncbi:hypothetical protein BC008_04520 [Mastigocoleus testarum BC008]|uniref:Tetratricopeptide repeat protein n=1 Tax=Mastigocoleus testarum BC008 TaxID=371196 RepID=A0A0V7ZYB8_9CYAN|nr:hypothetical protein BC008_04520 [Mastigocoleus testarum BC008]
MELSRLITSRSILPYVLTKLAIAISPTTTGNLKTYNQFMRLGYAAMQRKDYRVAAQYFRYALYENPRDRRATIAFWNARNLIKGNNQPESAYDGYMEAGYDATEEGKYKEALDNFRKALSERPEDYYATQAVRNITTYLNRGQKPSSPTDVDLVAKYYLGEAPYDRYMRLGYAAQQRDDYQAALRNFRSALFQRPNDRQATIAYWNAKDQINAGKSKSSQDETAYDRFMRIGYDATEKENYQRALRNFRKALEERPRDYYATQAIRNVQVYLKRGQELTGN